MDVLLVHGFTQTGASWARVRAALPERYRALTPDLRGHGSAADAAPVDLESVIGDLARVAGERLILCGYSMGGRIALHAALAPAFAGRVERLVLIGASPGIADARERAVRRADDERLAEEIERAPGIEVVARRWAAKTPVLAGQPPDVAALAHADRLRNTPAGLARALRGLGTGALPSLWERLDELRMPVALVVGARDAKFRAIADDMATRIASAEVVPAAGAGHTVHLEAPDVVAAAIMG
jgi:2-succinyl-6-hydroxy-2,4-cyclohexadiene-1-carboxylate synthase